MQSIALKILFRKKNIQPTIIAIALLVAILTSIVAIVNHVNLQTETIGNLPEINSKYLIMSKNATSATNSKINTQILNTLNQQNIVQYANPQKLFTATIRYETKNYTITIRATGNSQTKSDNSTIQPIPAKIGKILSRITSINKGNQIEIIIGKSVTIANITDITQNFNQSDAEIKIPLNQIQALNQDDKTLSIIELELQNTNQDKIKELKNILPDDITIIATQQTKPLITEINTQTVYFINLWSIPIYVIITVTTYMIATRLIIESKYELTTLKSIGAKRKQLFTLIFTATITISILGTILGIAMGLVGTQIISTIIRWIWNGFAVIPFLQLQQIGQILLLTTIASIAGSLLPALRVNKNKAMEANL